jgi:hypothetical protein
MRRGPDHNVSGGARCKSFAAAMHGPARHRSRWMKMAAWMRARHVVCVNGAHRRHCRESSAADVLVVTDGDLA